MSNRRRLPKDRGGVLELRIVDDLDRAAVDLTRYKCPDCNSVSSPVDRPSKDRARIKVAHDDSCPWLARWSGS